VDVIVDEDGYTELRYWADPVATPAEVAYAITSALAAITPNLAVSPGLCLEQIAGYDPMLTGRRPNHARPITGYDGAVTECAGDSAMAGPPDQMTEPGHIPDPVHPREPDRVDAELRQRMERLEPGHPSSPYKGDGSPKPPVPDPFKNELPIPGDPDYQQDPPTAHELSTASRATSSDRAPENRLERRLTPEESWIADQAVGRCHEAEGRDPDGNYGERGLTPAMRGVDSQLEHGKLAPETEKFALKGADRFKEKLLEMIKSEPDKPADELVREIHDGIRYTFIFDPDQYISGLQELTSRLEEKGYELGVCKNTWSNDEYKGVNTRWLDHESGLRFEVQIHTEQSWIVKQRTHEAYVKINDTGISATERERLRDYQREMTAQLVPPPGSQEIIDYRKEGW